MSNLEREKNGQIYRLDCRIHPASEESRFRLKVSLLCERQEDPFQAHIGCQDRLTTLNTSLIGNPAYLVEKEERERRYQFAGRFNSLVEDFNDYETQINNDIVIIVRYQSREFASLFGQGERVNRGYGSNPDVFVLPALRDILERIITENTHLTDRAQELLDELDETDIAKGLELTEDEKNPPPEPKKELRFSLGDKVYIGSKEYEILRLDDPVVLFDPDFPILTQDKPTKAG